MSGVAGRCRAVSGMVGAGAGRSSLSWSRAMANAGVVALLAGCSDSTVSLGPDPDFIWWTDHESGDLRDWDRQGLHWESEGGELTMVSEPTRSGDYAVKSNVIAQSGGTLSAAMLFAQHLPAIAYCSAWLYVPEPVAPSAYWVFFKLGSRTNADDESTTVDVWDFNLEPNGDQLLIRAVPRQGQALDALADHVVPIGRWFQVEAYLRASADGAGELRLWLDDQLLVEYRGPTAPSSYVGWTLGGGAEDLESGQATLVIDDAAVTSRRLGPDFPVFWRP